MLMADDEDSPKARGIRTNSDKPKFPYEYQAKDGAGDKC